MILDKGKQFVVDDISDEEYIGMIKKHKEEWDRELSNAMMAYCLGLLVPVVRCKDCRWSDTYPDMSDATMPLKCLGTRYGGVYPDWYCEHGERRGEE